MKRLMRIKRPLAAFMLLIFTCNMLLPSVAFALTSGPVQPEMKGFEPAGTANLVDAFSGDFTYNIPLMDVGGYPVNIAYHSGSGMDDEAGWVGFGWSLNPGVIDRQMRGLPDDFNGADADGDRITKEFNQRSDITGGVDFSFSPEVFGFDIGKVASVGVGAGIFYNNKRGLGIQFGLNANAPLLSNNKNNAGTNTAGLSAMASLNFNSQNGASFNPSINYSVAAKERNDWEKNTSSLGLGASISSRAGLQYVSLGASFNTTRQEYITGRKFSTTLNASYTSYASQTFLPETQADYFNQSYAVAPQFGPEAWGFFAGLQLTGHYSIQKVANPFASYPAYGFMHGNEGKNDNKALMDFNREKDVPYFDGVPNLPVPVATPDLFTANAQDGSGQYRAYLGGTGIFSDHDATNTSVSASLGLEVGAGAGFKLGGDVQASLSKTTTTKWKSGDKFLYEDNNSYDQYGNFTGAGDGPDASYEPVYFKRVGESIPVNGSIYDKIKGNIPVRIKTKGEKSGPTALNIFAANDNTETPITNKITRDNREVRNNAFSYLTNEQVKVAGLDRQVTDYYLAAGGFKPFLNKCATNTAEVLQPYKKDHHIGEITITDEGGARKIYGIPAYNTYQEDVSFSIGQNTNPEDISKGLVNYTNADASVNNKNGLDHYYSKEIIPGYAHSFLLTGILSPDYVDLHGDGITDDDLGTAVKFNYWRKTDKFQWRTPYAAGKANYNEGLKSDKMDDRGNYSYGRKELWYMHSIESKTMVAVFETGDREDALGADEMGNKDDASTENRQQYLKKIKLYSKADWYKDPVNAQPVKTVHFVYDYSLFADPNDITRGVPNNSGTPVTGNENVISNQGGKLTLKKIYFTYQNNTKGVLQPYEFQYDFNKSYEWKQYDRWGNYKNVNDGNPAGVTNDYYVYSTQDKTKADANAALWQLTQVATPAGGIIKVQYESDDYSYVQNKKAMQMYPMAGVGAAVNDNSGYYRGDKIYVKLPQSVASDEELRAKYFDGGTSDDSKNLFFKAYVKLTSGKDLYDYVSGYAEIDNIGTDVKLAAGQNDVAEIKVKTVKGEGVSTTYHPIAKAAWQFMRLNTPALVYPGYNVREDIGPVQFVKALVGAISSISELLAPFDTRAEIKQLSPSIDLRKSWVRLNASTNDTKKINGADYYAKLGGGARVKEVSMSDEWNAMSQSGAETASYGMVYDYTTTMTLSDGEKIVASSGVVSYEPMIGNDENPFHQPTGYQQKVKLGPDNVFFIDNPLCESYFPAASVGYSRVTVRNKGADGQTGATGYTVSEFFTEKDYPTIVNHTPIDAQRFGGASILQMLKIKKNNSRVVSQGYTIELNDMQGRPKSEKVIDKGGNELSSAYYYYKTVNEDAPEKQLNNEALVLQRDGTVSNSIIGRDVEMYSDMRNQTSFTAGLNVLLNLDAIYLLFAIVPVPVVLPLPNAEYTGFRSASTIKVIQQYGILNKVIKRQNGSQITTENLAWDANTGEVLLTRTQNEFDDPVYSLSYPSHWSYDEGMGPAYKNLGLMISNFSVTGGLIVASAATQLLVSGDELLIKNNSGVYQKYWVNKAGLVAPTQLVLIDENGNPVTSLYQVNALVVRSGRRNMHSMAVGSLVSLVNPVKNGKLDIGVFTKILDANGSVYNDEWAISVAQSCEPDVLNPIITTEDVTICAGDQDGSYSKCGTFMYDQLAYNGPSSSRHVLSPGNPFWWRYPNGGCHEDPLPAGNTRMFIQDTLNSNSRIAASSQSTLSVPSGPPTDQGPLIRCGIWACGVNVVGTIGYSFPLTISQTSGKPYYLGIACDNMTKLYIDNVLQVNLNSDNNFWIWHIFPLPASLLTVGSHTIRIEGLNTGSLASFGCEIYNNTETEIASAASYSDLNVLFTTRDKIGTTKQLITGISCPMPDDYHLDNTVNPPVCRKNVAAPLPINPYTTGLRGNWRLQKSFAYHTDREAKLPYIKSGDPDVIEKTDIRKSGAYIAFSPFWKYETGKWLSQEQQSVNDANWVKANEMTVVNQKGQEIENVDALNRYSAAQFGYLQSMVTAVASNARYTDIGYDGFEDYDFDVDNCNNPDTCNLNGHFSVRRLSRKYPSAIIPDATYAHTGRNALKVTGAVDAVITKQLTPAAAGTLYTFTGAAMYLTDKGMLNGFRPQPGKTYLLSAWIKDDGTGNSSISADISTNVQLSAGESTKAAIDIVSGGYSFSTVKAGPRVEGWRKVEVVFLVPANATDIRIKFRPGSSAAYFDDIRIHPFDAQMKTYAYDNKSMRLWAEMDENNFATFYEYDDEGILIRVKKETERGIMTIKETRSVYRFKK